MLILFGMGGGEGQGGMALHENAKRRNDQILQ